MSQARHNTFTPTALRIFGAQSNFRAYLNRYYGAPRTSIVNDESRHLGIVAKEWGNLQELNETYQIWRHNGNPFEDSSLSSSDEGWELVLDNSTRLDTSPTVIRNVPIQPDSEQDAYYAVTVCDEFNNCNLEILEGMTQFTSCT